MGNPAIEQAAHDILDALKVPRGDPPRSVVERVATMPAFADLEMMDAQRYRQVLEDILKNVPPQGMDAQDWHEKVVAPVIRKAIED